MALEPPIGSHLLIERASHVVMKLDDAVWELLDRTELERHVAMARGDQGHSLANEYRDHADDEFVDRAFVQEGW